MAKIIDVIQLILIIILIIFGLFLLYQIILKISGGSWQTEDVIVALLILNISFTFAIALNQVRYSVDYSYFKKEFYYLRKDFIGLAKDFKKQVSLDNR